MDEFMVHKIHKSEANLQTLYEEAKDTEPWLSRYQYRLYGIVSHSGSMGGGHYVAYTCYEHQG
jgi:ubiquitin C-terminal hydrolase